MQKGKIRQSFVITSSQSGTVSLSAPEATYREEGPEFLLNQGNTPSTLRKNEITLAGEKNLYKLASP